MFSSMFKQNAVRKVQSAVVALSLLLGLAQQASAEIPADFDKFVEDAMKKYSVPGVAVAIVDGDKVFTKGYGVRSVAKPGAVDADTLFMLASCSKSFTAALVAIMVDKKKFGWNDHVIDYLPEFVLKDQYATRMTTPVDLLAHRTGLPAFSGDNLEALGFTRDQSLFKFRYMKPACSFRESANYSNPGLVSAGMLAAKVGGDSYENLIKKEIYEPLNMVRSGVSSKDYANQDNIADAHHLLPDGTSKVVPLDSSDTFGPAGGLTSTANDMAKWMQLHLNEGQFGGKQVISKESIKMMHTPAAVEEPGFADMPPISENSGFAFSPGWGIFHYKGHVVVEKGGARSGVRSTCVMVPDSKFGVTVLANQNLTVIGEAIRAYLLDKMIAPAGVDVQKQISDANDQVKKIFIDVKPIPKPTTNPTLPLKNYTGEYENEMYGKLKVYQDGDKLRWEAGPDKVSGSITHVNYDVFSLAWPPGRISLPEDITFTLGTDGYPVSLSTESFGELKRVSK